MDSFCLGGNASRLWQPWIALLHLASLLVSRKWLSLIVVDMYQQQLRQPILIVAFPDPKADSMGVVRGWMSPTPRSPIQPPKLPIRGPNSTSKQTSCTAVSSLTIYAEIALVDTRPYQPLSVPQPFKVQSYSEKAPRNGKSQGASQRTAFYSEGFARISYYIGHLVGGHVRSTTGTCRGDLAPLVVHHDDLGETTDSLAYTHR